MKSIELNEQEIEFIKWSMQVIEDEDTWSNTSKTIAKQIINKLEESNENI